MEAAECFVETVRHLDRKAEREQKIASLESEKASLQSEIAAMKEKIAQLEFERSVRALESEIEALRTEKTSLEERALAYESEMGGCDMKDTDKNKSSLLTIRASPAVPTNAGQVPLGQSRAEQARVSRDAVPDRTSNQQRPSAVPAIPKAVVSHQTQEVKTKDDK